MRAIFIDSKNRDITEITIKGNDYKEIAKIIDCGIIAGGYKFENADYMYVDDEGLFQSNGNSFIINSDIDIDIVGNALIIGIDEDGNDIDATSTIEEIKNIITFHKFY